MTSLSNGLYSLSQLFSDNFFVIPDFQRGYAWGKRQVDEFWKDLELLHVGARHYAGQLILEAAGAPGSRQYLVVDGQQRLTTSYLALKAAVDVFRQSESKALREQADTLTRLFHYEERDALRTYRLCYADGSPTNAYLSGVIFQDARHRAQASDIRTLYTENIRSAYDIFGRKFAELTPEQALDMVERITDALLCNVFCVTKDFDVHVAFETINNRGRELSKLELLKNRLIYLTTVFGTMPGTSQARGRDLRKEINDSWSSIYKWLGNDPGHPLDDDDFLSTHWIAYFGYDKSEADALKVALFEEYFTARSVREASLTIGDVQCYIRSLAQAATVWHYLHVPTRYLPGSCVTWLERIERLRWSSFKPLLLSAFLRLAADVPRVVTAPAEVTRDIEQLVPLLRQVERYIFMVYYMAEWRGHTGRSEIYGIAAILCPDGLKSELGATAADDLAWAARRVGAMNDNGIGDAPRRHSLASDADFHARDGYFNLNDFKDNVQRRLGRGEGFYNWDFTKIVLFEYEQALQGHHNAPKVTWKHVSNETIEHIYPQTPSDAYWLKRFPYDRRQIRKQTMWRNSLGNLLLLSRSVNSSVGNADFTTKVAEFKKGSFSATSLAADYKHWTPKHVVERGEKILKFLENRWDLRFKDYSISYKECLVVPELAKD